MPKTEAQKEKRRRYRRNKKKRDEAPTEDFEPDWTGKCEVCGASPIVPATGMCGPCTFGEAETVNGN